MRKLSLLACVVLLALALGHVGRSGVPEGARRAARNLALPFRIAAFYLKEPDRELAMPVESVRVRQVKNSWHAPRSGGRLHEGQDIFAERGTIIRSATDGYVARVGETPLGGKTVTVVGAGGRRYYYAHLDDYAAGLATGDHVTAESVLGYVGTTGNAAGTPPHLHFGVYTPAGVTDPLPLLTDRPEQTGRQSGR